MHFSDLEDPLVCVPQRINTRFELLIFGRQSGKAYGTQAIPIERCAEETDMISLVRPGYCFINDPLGDPIRSDIAQSLSARVAPSSNNKYTCRGRGRSGQCRVEAKIGQCIFRPGGVRHTWSIERYCGNSSRRRRRRQKGFEMKTTSKSAWSGEFVYR